MALVKTASFEAGGGPIERIITLVLASFIDMEQAGLAQNFVDMFGVVLPVCGDMQGASALQFSRNEREKSRLYDSPLLMPLFRPGIGKIEIYTADTAVRNLVLQYVDGVVTDDPEISE